ncbi:hypothetical protein J6590_055958 [Homalodisca vitripennis]|nr:hypothetical protein J6590_055958 [Homalodisca vitripennis]
MECIEARASRPYSITSSRGGSPPTDFILHAAAVDNEDAEHEFEADEPMCVVPDGLTCLSDEDDQDQVRNVSPVFTEYTKYCSPDIAPTVGEVKPMDTNCVCTLLSGDGALLHVDSRQTASVNTLSLTRILAACEESDSHCKDMRISMTHNMFVPLGFMTTRFYRPRVQRILHDTLFMGIDCNGIVELCEAYSADDSIQITYNIQVSNILYDALCELLVENGVPVLHAEWLYFHRHTDGTARLVEDSIRIVGSGLAAPLPASQLASAYSLFNT